MQGGGWIRRRGARHCRSGCQIWPALETVSLIESDDRTHLFVVEQNHTADVGFLVCVLGRYCIAQAFDGSEAGKISARCSTPV